MRLTASIIAGFAVMTGTIRAEDEITRVIAEVQPETMPTRIPGTEQSGEIPPFLTVPNEAPVRISTRKSCRTCATDYNPNLAYLPDHNPDCRNGQCPNTGCTSTESCWGNVDFIAGLGSDIRDIKHQTMYGVKLGLGFWMDSENRYGIDAGFLNVHDPYRDIFLGQLGPTLVDSPLTLTTGDLNLRAQLLTHGRFRIDGLVGYRYLNFHEQLLESTPVATNFWKTTNEVNLGQLGLASFYRFGPYTGEIIAKVGFGRNSESFSLNGVRTTTSESAVVPELGVRLGYGLGQGVRSVIGYNLIYLNNAVRPDNREPSSFLLQGLTAGLEFRY